MTNMIMQMVRDSFVRPERHPEVSSGEDGHESAMVQDSICDICNTCKASRDFRGENGHESAI
jgi:hypothetical protein